MGNSIVCGGVGGQDPPKGSGNKKCVFRVSIRTRARDPPRTLPVKLFPVDRFVHLQTSPFPHISAPSFCIQDCLYGLSKELKYTE